MTATSAAMSRSVTLKRDAWAGHFIVSMIVNGVRIRAIVDTGAAYTVLTPADAAAIGADRSVKRREAAIGVGGRTSMAVTALGSVEVAGQRIDGVTARIGQTGLPYTLLGQTEIARLGRIVIENGEMTIEPRPIRIAAR